MTTPATTSDTAQHLTPTWLLIGSHGLWAADCIVPGCLWTTTASAPEAADTAAADHALTEHREVHPA